MSSIGSRIRDRREELNLSQDELAKRLGYKSRSSINKIELDQRNITQSKIKSIADVLETTPAYIMGWTEENNGPILVEDNEQLIEKSDYMSAFPERLKLLRKQFKLSQRDLAAQTGINSSSIAMYEQGKREPGISTIKLFANYFNVSVDYLIGSSDDSSPKIFKTAGERIRHLREELGISQKDLAEAIGTQSQNLYKYEQNIIENIPSDKVEALADALRVSPSYIMGWDLNSAPANSGIPERLHSLRESRGLTLDQVGEYIGVNRATILRYENGNIDISRPVAIKLAELYGVSPSYIMCFDNIVPVWTKYMDIFYNLTPVEISKLREYSNFLRYQKSEKERKED